jgi:uncharacterized membrane protein
MARTTQERKRRRQARNGGEEAASKGRDAVEDQESDDDGEDDDGSSLDGMLNGDGGVFKQLKNTATDAALVVLKPVAKRAATRAAEFAVEKGPQLMEDKVLPKLVESGGPKALVEGFVSGNGAGGAAKGLLERVTGGGNNGDDGGGSDAGDGTGKGRRMPVQQSVDVAAPIDVVYDQFTQFEDYPKFMHRVESVEQNDDTHVVFNEKMWGIRRRWEAEIVEQRPDERIVWKTVSGLSHTGVVTFHDMAERLTRIELNIDVDPHGPIEKMGRGLRFVKRAARADLKRFKAYVEMHEEETGAWRGEIQDAEVVEEHDDSYEDEYEDDDEYVAEDEEEPEAEADEDEEPEAEEEEQPEASEDEEEEPEDEEDEEDEAPRRPRRSSSSKSRSGSGSSTSRSRSRGSSSKGSSSKGSSAKSQSKSKSSSSSGRSRSRGSSSGGSSKSKPKSSSSRSGSSRKKSSSGSRKS